MTMQLTVDEQWILAYMNTRIHNWGDVRDDAVRAMKRIKDHRDFVDWTDYFLPKSRKEEIKRALTEFKKAKAKQKAKTDPKVGPRQIPIQLDERVAQILIKKAEAEKCSISEYLIKRLAS